MSHRRSRSWQTDQSPAPVIVEREPSVRSDLPLRPKRRSKKLTIGFKFANPFRSRKTTTRRVLQSSPPRRVVVHQERVDLRDPEPQRSTTPTEFMFRSAHQDGFVPLPPPLSSYRQHHPDPIIEVRSPVGTRRPELHQFGPDRFGFPAEGRDFPQPLMRDPERVIARERDRRRDADRVARELEREARAERQRRRDAEAEAHRISTEAVRERDRRREVEDITQRIGRVAVQERESRRQAQEDARQAEAETQEAEERARRLERELNQVRRERTVAERERVVLERQRRQEEQERADEIARNARRRSVHIIQPDLPIATDRGADVIRQAQDAARRRRDEESLYGHERDRHRRGPRRQRSITIFEDDNDRRRHRQH